MSESESVAVETSASSRIQQLERSHQRLLGLVVLLVIAAFVHTALHYLPHEGPVMATRFVVVRPGGPPRAELSLWNDGTPALRINNANGEARALLALYHDGTLSLRMSDSRFGTRLEMAVAPDGQPRVTLYGPDGRSRASAWIDGSGQGRFDSPR